MEIARDPKISPHTGIAANLKPLAPWWQWMIGLMFFGAGVGGFSVITDSPRSIAYSILVLGGIAAVMAYFLRNKTIPITLTPGDGCLLLKDPTRPGLGKLVPLRVEQNDNRSILVERKGSRWELKRIELRFSTSKDTAMAASMLRRFLPNP